MDVGLGLWTMRSTAAFPASHAALHADLIADAELVQGRSGFESPDLLDKQGQRAIETGLFGSAAHVAERLLALAELGIDMVVLHLAGDGRHPQRGETVIRIAERLLPVLRA